MSSLKFIKNELAAAIARGVRQCVVISLRPPLWEAFRTAPEQTLQLFAIDEEEPEDSPGTFVSTHFASEALPAALAKTEFDQFKSSLFVWLGDARYRTVEAAMASLSFIASLPKGSGVVLDYAVERPSVASLTDTALDALASRVCGAGGTIKQLIQPQAVAAMLRGLGFQTIVDVPHEELRAGGAHLVTAMV